MKSFKRVISIIFCLLFILNCSLMAFAAETKDAPTQDELITSFTNPNGRVLSVANLGNTREYPENSLEGINSCIELGVDAVTVKVQLTKDNQLVLLSNNDLSINCATKEKGTAVMGKASEYSLDDLQAKFVLRAGHGNGTSATGCGLTSLKEAITAANGKIILIVVNGASYSKEINTLVREIGATDYVVIGGFEVSSLVESTVTTMAVYKDEDGKVSDVIETSINAGAFILEADVTKARSLSGASGKIRLLMDMSDEDLCGGLEDRTSGWSQAIELGYSMIVTDYPTDLVYYLNRIETIRTNLSTLIGTAASMDTSSYTKTSRKALETALDEAKEISGKGCLSLDEADSAYYNLQEAIDGLTVSTDDEKLMLPAWLVVVIVIAAIIVTIAIVILVLRIVNKAKRSKKRLDKFKEKFSSDVPVENDESLTTNIEEDQESNMGIEDVEEPDTDDNTEISDETEESIEDNPVENVIVEVAEQSSEEEVENTETVEIEQSEENDQILVNIDYGEDSKETEE